MTRFPRLKSVLYGVPLAILEDRAEAIVDVIERRADGIYLTAEEIAATKGERRYNGMIETFDVAAYADAGPMREGAQKRKADAAAPFASASGASSGGVIAVINVSGIIAQHAHQVDDISGPGGTSTERVAQSFRAAMADPNVTAIIFNHDSPGGSVSGVQALADEIFAARGKKPIVSQVNSMMASAAYWIGAASDEIVMTPGAQAGSIGVYMMHKDVSKAADNEGVKVTFIKAGRFKTEGNPFEALGEEAAAAFQASVDSYYKDFVDSVARSRGVKPKAVRNGFGEGRMLKDVAAVDAGLADSVATLDQTIRRLATNSAGKPKTSGRAKADSSDARSFSVRKEQNGDAISYSLVEGSWPEKVTMEEELLIGSACSKLLDEDVVAFNFSNASAQYKIIGENNAGYLVLSLISGSVDQRAAPPPDEGDAWRRRRHAHRLRT